MPRKKRRRRTRQFGRYSKRNYHDPVYKKWRTDVKTRDEYQCQWPGCRCRNKLQVHHIKKWCDYPSMRYVVANGITLCKKCHDKVKDQEVDLESFFLNLLERKMLNRLKRMSDDN